MSIDFLFKVALRLYNILIRIKNFPRIIKYRKSLKEAKKITELKNNKRSDTVREGTVSDMDFGDWLMQEGKATQEEYEKKLVQAKELLNV